jgi:hypothetical protein
MLVRGEMAGLINFVFFGKKRPQSRPYSFLRLVCLLKEAPKASINQAIVVKYRTCDFHVKNVTTG